MFFFTCEYVASLTDRACDCNRLRKSTVDNYVIKCEISHVGKNINTPSGISARSYVDLLARTWHALWRKTTPASPIGCPVHWQLAFVGFN